MALFLFIVCVVWHAWKAMINCSEVLKDAAFKLFYRRIPVVEVENVKISSHTVDRVRNLKNAMTRLTARVQKLRECIADIEDYINIQVRDELEQLLDDDMADLYLSRKFAGSSSPVTGSGVPNWYPASPTNGSKISRASGARAAAIQADDKMAFVRGAAFEASQTARALTGQKGSRHDVNSRRQAGFQLGQQYCRLERISAQEPRRHVPSEAGFTENVDQYNGQLQCAGVAACRCTIAPRGLLVPQYHNDPNLINISQGQELLGLLVPGCTETCQSFQQQLEQQEQIPQYHRFCDEHQKAQRFIKYDDIAIPAGVSHWDVDSSLTTIQVSDTNNNVNQLEPKHRDFLLASRHQLAQQALAAPAPQEHQAKNVLSGFNTELLAEEIGNETLYQTIDSYLKYDSLSDSPVSVCQPLSNIGSERHTSRRLWNNDWVRVDVSLKDGFFLEAEACSGNNDIDAFTGDELSCFLTTSIHQVIELHLSQVIELHLSQVIEPDLMTPDIVSLENSSINSVKSTGVLPNQSWKDTKTLSYRRSIPGFLLVFLLVILAVLLSTLGDDTEELLFEAVPT